MYLIRLDDASEYMDLEKWVRIYNLLAKYDIKPIVGIIPNNRDDCLISKYKYNATFWDMIHDWVAEGWTPAMHGYEHRYITKDGGINPIHKRSEFAGLTFEKQAEKIRKGYEILLKHGITPDIFFAPSHTFDENTLKAIKIETPIRIISDTIALDIYKDDGFWFIPQQSGSVRKLPFKIVTFCYHPNMMNEQSFNKLEAFIIKQSNKFVDFQSLLFSDRKKTKLDKILNYMYLRKHR
ncbi:DUF2334 domain-containing protein [Aristaeella hokkaidonensis]|uniref:DUF2334 domain-containing protein n=1 Tax=Aristaeella hokkaidonensis TaxID=3046382 RepID=A0AC61MYJ7_9FIRM|nr:DUF2334 domain-containing protein [Aristaeella hokkaidonensis]QUC68214.1 DUF2334 domain-containing protein [Aristaeella hokkaidonensis]SNT95226.1 hypothetical protein SAMN06297421_11113 [Aristaeella hokkaidonensis]